MEIDERLGVFGMSAVQWRALHCIGGHSDLPQRRLAQLMGQTAQAFGTLLRRLSRCDHLVRRRGRGKAAMHQLTAHGRIMLEPDCP